MREEVVMIPKKQYEKMVASYDEAMRQLEELKQLLKASVTENAPE